MPSTSIFHKSLPEIYCRDSELAPDAESCLGIPPRIGCRPEYSYSPLLNIGLLSTIFADWRGCDKNSPRVVRLQDRMAYDLT